MSKQWLGDAEGAAKKHPIARVSLRVTEVEAFHSGTRSNIASILVVECKDTDAQGGTLVLPCYVVQ